MLIAGDALVAEWDHERRHMIVRLPGHGEKANAIVLETDQDGEPCVVRWLPRTCRLSAAGQYQATMQARFDDVERHAANEW